MLDSLKVMAMSFQSGHFPKLVCVCRVQYLISVNDVIKYSSMKKIF